jgi:hypothetical protein
LNLNRFYQGDFDDTKRMKKTKDISIFCILLITLLISTAVRSQVKFSGKISGNYVIIPTVIESHDSNEWPNENDVSYSINESYSSKSGFELDFGVQTKIFKRFTIETGLGLASVKYARNVNTSFQKTGFGKEYINTDLSLYYYLYEYTNRRIYYKRSLLYLNIPLKINYQIIINKATVSAGIYASAIVDSKRSSSTEIKSTVTEKVMRPPTDSDALRDRWLPDSYEFPPPRLVTDETILKSGERELTKVVYYSCLGVQCRVVNDLWLSGEYSYSLSSLYHNSTVGSRFIKAGIKYYF